MNRNSHIFQNSFQCPHILELCIIHFFMRCHQCLFSSQLESAMCVKLFVCCCCIASVMSDSVRPHRWQPSRLPHPWDSPGKNTGLGCHFLLQCMKVKSESEVAQLCLTLATPWTAAYQAPLSMGFSRQKYWSGVPLPSPSFSYAAAAAKLLQSCPTLCDPRDGSPPGSPVPGILQARTLEWVAISFSNA